MTLNKIFDPEKTYSIRLISVVFFARQFGADSTIKCDLRQKLRN